CSPSGWCPAIDRGDVGWRAIRIAVRWMPIAIGVHIPLLTASFFPSLVPVSGYLAHEDEQKEEDEGTQTKELRHSEILSYRGTPGFLQACSPGCIKKGPSIPRGDTRAWLIIVWWCVPA